LGREIDDLRRREFPVTRQWAYLNHAVIGPLPERSGRAMRLCLEGQSRSGSVREGDWEAKIEELRRRTARLIGASPDEIAILKNTSEGLSLVAHCTGIGPGDSVVVPECEFPANLRPYIDLERKGVELRFVREREGRLLAEDFERLVDGSTKLVAVSFVQYATGFRADLAAIAGIAHRAGALLSVDAIQGLGALRMDVGALGIDFLSAGSYKWLLGPVGLGVFWCPARHLERLSPPTWGWMGLQTPYDFSNVRQEPASGARRFEIGGIGYADVCGLAESMGLLLEFGPERIERRVKELTDRLVAGARERALAVRSPRGEGEWSGIVSVVPRSDAASVVARLAEKGIVAAPRAGAVRAAVHFYNTPEEIDRFLEGIDEAP
jgi:selenocysteine lyase/cysteine desulfurase